MLPRITNSEHTYCRADQYWMLVSNTLKCETGRDLQVLSFYAVLLKKYVPLNTTGGDPSASAAWRRLPTRPTRWHKDRRVGYESERI